MCETVVVSDELWEVVAPLLPKRQRQRTGRPRVDDRVVFRAVLFVLQTGIAWRHLPRELGCSKATAWRRFRDWQQTGVFERLHVELLGRLNRAGLLDWSRAVADSSQIRALQGGSRRALAG